MFGMGAISALIVGPCVAAPLAGALLYISQTPRRGDRRLSIVRDGGWHERAAASGWRQCRVAAAARFGQWMESIKRLFGMLLIAVALWMISPVIPAWAQMLACAALLIVSATYLRALDALASDASGCQRLWKGVGLVLLVLGAVQIVGAASGGLDVLRPLQPLTSGRDVFKAQDRLRGAMFRTSTNSMRRSPTQAASPFCSTSTPTGASHARRWIASRSPIHGSRLDWPACSC